MVQYNKKVKPVDNFEIFPAESKLKKDFGWDQRKTADSSQ